MEKKINLILPYFGKLPNYFQLYLNSCSQNKNINWTIITDDKSDFKYPSNVKVVYMSFEDLKKKIQEKFDFPISLPTPYKLCDYKVAYGYIFSEYNDNYDFWGFCDADVIYGDLEKYLTNEVLSYTKVFTLGHFTLFKNEPSINTLFMEKINGEEYFKKVYTSSDIFNFDETMNDRININMIFAEKGIKVYDNTHIIADIYTKSSNFKIINGKTVEKYRPSFFLWDNGKLYRYIRDSKIISREEYMYIHLQKRKMRVNIEDNTENLVYKIIPHSFDKLEISKDDINNNFSKIRLKYFNMHYFKIRYNNLKTKIIKRLKNKGISM